MNIKVEYDPKPIPLRQYDWEAWDNDDENTPIGYGLTAKEAVEDLLQKIEE